jgi:sugar lactone lactonase YvrE
MKALLKLLALAAVVCAVYLTVAPTPLDPQAWTPPPIPRLEGIYQVNQGLAGATWLARGQLEGPESLAFDPAGHLYTGTRDGRILRVGVEHGDIEKIASTGGRPLGLAWHAPTSKLIVADADAGLLSVDPTSGNITPLTITQGGVPFHLVDDVAITNDGTIYFTDASSRYPLREYVLDLMEHRPSGRLLAYHQATQQTELLAGNLYFANGLALDPAQQYLVVVETGRYRVLRYWLAGSRRGTTDVLIDNLPGFPDNVTTSPRGTFWLAIASPRQSLLDQTLPHPGVRRVMSRLPPWLRPHPERHGFVIELDGSGRVLRTLQDPASTSYSPVTTARERDGKLYLGSMEREAIGVIVLPALAGTP